MGYLLAWNTMKALKATSSGVPTFTFPCDASCESHPDEAAITRQTTKAAPAKAALAAMGVTDVRSCLARARANIGHRAAPAAAVTCHTGVNICDARLYEANSSIRET